MTGRDLRDPRTHNGRDTGRASGATGSPAIVIRSRVVAGVLAAVAALLLVVDLVLQTVEKWLAPGSIAWEQFERLLDLNSESSIPTWYAVVLLAVAALLVLNIAIDRRRAGDRFARHWFLLALLVAGFSIDEAAQIHDAPSSEPFREILGTGGLLYYPWVIIGLVTGIVVLILGLKFLRHLPGKTRNLLLLSAGLFAAGAIGLEMAGGWLRDRDPDATLVIETLASFEETLELSGAIILIYALLDYAGDRLGETRIVWKDAPEPESEEQQP